MPSLVWGRDPQEAFRNPYEYEVQDQFVREARPLLRAYYELLNVDDLRFTRDDRSVKKSIWLLQLDTLDSLTDCLDALTRKEHRVAGKLFRIAVETMDLAAFFASDTTSSRSQLDRWYDNEFVPHRVYRDHVQKSIDERTAQELREHYQSLSRFVHRSYRAIMDGYTLGVEGRLVHDAISSLDNNEGESRTFLVLPHTIAAYLATLANLILLFTEELHRRRLVPEGDVAKAFEAVLEPGTVRRRFVPSEWLLERIKNESRNVEST